MREGYDVWCDICKTKSKRLPPSAFRYGATDICRGRRVWPVFEKHFPELAFLDHDGVRGALSYEEAFVAGSDARFVLDWILPERWPLFHSSLLRPRFTLFGFCVFPWFVSSYGC